MSQCQCGKATERLHCPNCGKLTCYATPSKAYIIQMDAGPIRIMKYTCRGCGISFDDLERAQCHAPKRGLSVKAQRVGDTVAVSLAGLPEEIRKEKINELFVKAGLVQETKSEKP